MHVTLKTIMMVAVLGAGTAVAAQAVVESGEGTRAQGMGGAFVAVADDPSAVYWNPAGLAGIRQTELLTSVSYSASDNAIGAGYAVIPAGSASAIGVGVTGVGGMGQYSLSLGTTLRERWLFGATINYYRSEHHSYEGNPLGYDIGTLYRFSPSFSAGLTFHPETRLSIEGEREVRVEPQKTGAGLSFTRGGLTLGAGYEYIGAQDEPTRDVYGDYEYFRSAAYRAGLEYRAFGGHLPLRAGVSYRKFIDYSSDDDLLSGTCGFGIWLRHFAVDLAFIRDSARSNGSRVDNNCSMSFRCMF